MREQTAAFRASSFVACPQKPCKKWLTLSLRADLPKFVRNVKMRPAGTRPRHWLECPDIPAGMCAQRDEGATVLKVTLEMIAEAWSASIVGSRLVLTAPAFGGF